MTSVSVIVPARNAGNTLGATLAGLARQQTPHPLEVVVVDDGSTDETALIARRSSAVSDVVEAGGIGPARARNAGVAASSGAALAFLDADCRPAHGWLAAGLRALEHADLVQGRVLPDPNCPRGPFDRTLFVTRAWGLFESANLFVRRELFDRIGGFESWLVPRQGIELGEDVLFGWSARRIGARTAFADEALAYHAVFPRSALEYVREFERLRFFPAMAARIPELRREFFYRRFFLSERSAAFDAALLGVLTALTSRRPLALLAAGPYLELVRRNRESPSVASVRAAGDLVGLIALLRGSTTARSLVI